MSLLLTHATDIWSSLGEGFSDGVKPAAFPQQILRYRNTTAAETLGLQDLTTSQWHECFALFQPLVGSLPQPQALRYHGHQFTHYNPELGDGRGFLYAQLKEKSQNKVIDLGTKGSGQTPYSRRGDGRLTLKGALREALATAYLSHLGVHTSKTLSVFETGEELIRNDEPSPTRSAVLVRASSSHIRFGTFQRLAYLGETHRIDQLLHHCLKHYYVQSTPDSFFEDVCEQVALTTAQWMIHGFVHGVLNTDNMNITGESFDYGPYRFLPYYDLKFTAAYFDHEGLYAYGRQPQMVQWNLERLWEALSLVIKNEQNLENGLLKFQNTFQSEVLKLFGKKIGIAPEQNSTKVKNLFYQCLQFLEKSKVPYQSFFDDLYIWHQDLNRPLRDLNRLLYWNQDIEDIEKNLAELHRDSQAPEKTDGDRITLYYDEIEAIWSAIDQQNDWSLLYQKLDKMGSPHANCVSN